MDESFKIDPAPVAQPIVFCRLCLPGDEVFSTLWQARVNRDWRFYFTIEDDAYVIHKLIPPEVILYSPKPPDPPSNASPRFTWARN